jgi:hypothetical protein
MSAETEIKKPGVWERLTEIAKRGLGLAAVAMIGLYILS